MTMIDDALPAGTDAFVLHKVFGTEYVDPYRDDPVGYIENVLGDFMWTFQKEAARAIAANPHVAVKACHGMGKSWLFARIIAWWVCTRPPEDTLVLFTAPTFSQVWSIIGKELGILHARASLPGRLLNKNTEWWIGEILVAQGLKPDDNNDNAFQGRHAKWTLGIGDEADGLPASIWTGLDAIATTDTARTCVAGNPMDPAGQFATVCGDNTAAIDGAAAAWDCVITVSVYDTPNFTGEHVPEAVAAALVSKSWVEKRRARWGEGSMLWEGRVMGRFPKTSEERLISPDLISAAQKRELVGWGIGRYALDVARFGDSETTLYRNRDGVIRIVDSSFKSSGPEVKRMARAALDAGSLQVPMNIDGDGVGGPIYDDLHEENYPVYEFRGGTSAIDKDDAVNLRSECYWNLRLAFQRGEVDIDPDDKVLAAQLSNIKWKIRKGKIAVESKDDMRARGVPSPDRADGAMMTMVDLGEAIKTWDTKNMPVEGDAIGGLTADLLDADM